MKIQYISLIFLLSFWLQACTATGPIHFYPGKPRPQSETAHLRVPGPISVMKIDGKKVDVRSIEDSFYEIFLLPGLHRIEFKYELYWGDPTSGMVVASNVVGIETPFRAGMNYELTYTIPENEREAYSMADDFKAKLVEQETGRQVISRALAELNEPGIKSTLVYGSRNTTQPKDNNISVVESAGVTTLMSIDADTATREDAVKRLKFWWLIANEDERKRFKEWTKSLESVGSKD